MDHLNNLFSKIVEGLEKEELQSASVIFKNSVFKKVIDSIVQVKKDAIVDEVKSQEELDYARLTLEGNREVFEIFKMLSTAGEPEKKEKFDENQII